MRDINATVIIDLDKSEEEIINNLHKDARWGINKARKENLIVEETNKEDDWEEFYEIYKETMKLGDSKAKELEELKAKSRVLFICKKDDKIIAGAAIWFMDIYDINIPRLYLNASLREYQNFQPNNLLYWNCILWGKKNNYKKFDFGGYQIKARGHLEGINKFKEKWGDIVYFHK